MWFNNLKLIEIRYVLDINTVRFERRGTEGDQTRKVLSDMSGQTLIEFKQIKRTAVLFKEPEFDELQTIALLKQLPGYTLRWRIAAFDCRHALEGLGHQTLVMH